MPIFWFSKKIEKFILYGISLDFKILIIKYFKAMWKPTLCKPNKILYKPWVCSQMFIWIVINTPNPVAKLILLKQTSSCHPSQTLHCSNPPLASFLERKERKGRERRGGEGRGKEGRGWRGKEREGREGREGRKKKNKISLWFIRLYIIGVLEKTYQLTRSIKF